MNIGKLMAYVMHHLIDASTHVTCANAMTFRPITKGKLHSILYGYFNKIFTIHNTLHFCGNYHVFYTAI